MARDAPSIDAFGGGGFRLSGAWHVGSVLILDDKAQAWPVTALDQATPGALAQVFAAGAREVEFVLLGTGAVAGLPPKALRENLRLAGIGLEFMDTPTAARMYNVFTAEGRRLAAALIAV